MKRLLDILVSLLGLIVVSPILLVAAIAVKVDSRGPVFFRHVRVGRNFNLIRVTKFRSMRTDKHGSSLTSGEDPRITRVGKCLRKFKVDELPQLWDVLVGNMSLVGPRPESPEFVQEFRDEYAELLKVRPGITDPSSIAYRSESELLGLVDEPERYYKDVVLPDKIRLSREYLRKATVWSDCRVIFETMAVCFRPADPNEQSPANETCER